MNPNPPAIQNETDRPFPQKDLPDLAGKLSFWALLGLSLALFLSHLAEIPHRSALRGWDNSFYFFWVRSAVIDGDWDFANDLELADTIAAKDRDRVAAMPLTETGRIPNKYGIGWGLLTLPWFFLADVLVRLFGGDRDGFGSAYQVLCLAGHYVYGWGGLWLAYRLLRRFFPRNLSQVACFGVWISSPLFYYQTVNLGMSHNLVFGLTLLTITLAYRIADAPQRAPWLHWAGLGLSAGLLLITRYPAALHLLFPLALVGPLLWNDARVRRVALSCLPAFLLPLFIQMLAWKQVFGNWVVFSYGLEDKGFSWLEPKLWEILFTSNHGAFYWHPVLLAGLLGFLFSFFPVRRSWGVLLFSFLLMAYINACWSSWNLASSFGYRGLEILWVLALPGLAALLQLSLDRGVWRNLGLGLVLVLGLWNLNLSILYRFEVVSRNGPVTWETTLTTSASFYPGLVSALGEGKSLYDWQPPEREGIKETD